MIDLIKKYVENRIQLVKFNLIGAIANVAAGMVSSFLLLVMGILILLMFSIALAFWFATFFESEIIGFALVGLMYLILFVVYALVAKDKVELKIKDKIVETALADVEDEINEPVEYEE
jgi:membrane protein implicated in regulation of membrane protease activity